jgi:hypothetical protein
MVPSMNRPVWHRIGIALSIIWALAAAVYVRADENSWALGQKDRGRNSCYAQEQWEYKNLLKNRSIVEGETYNSISKTYENCVSQVTSYYDSVLSRPQSAWPVIVFALGPIPFGWLLAYASAWLNRQIFER